MKLFEIINLEYQLYKDAQDDPAGLRDRDRKIGREYEGPEEDRVALFRFWLKKLEKDNLYPGQPIVSSLAFSRYFVFFFFLISGATTCAGVLSYDGSRPVNIVNFLAVFVGFQILLYLLFLLNILPAVIRRKIPLIGDFYRFAGFILTRIIGIIGNHLYKNRTETIRRITGLFNRAKSRHVIYSKIERWALFSITQLGGFAFSLGALAACAYLITFSDLAFAWNTTLDVSADFFHRIVSAISTPWAVFSNQLVPTPDLVESTRYFRLDGSYSSVHSSALAAGGWWPFLICTLIFYGLIPRFILLMLSRFALFRAQKRAPFLSSEFDSLYRRLTFPIFSIRTENESQSERRPELQEFKVSNEPSVKSEACYLIVWGEIDLPEAEVTDIIQSGFGWKTRKIFYAGMLDILQDEQTLGFFEGSKDDEPILMLAESWEAPSKAVEHFLYRLRSRLEIDRRILIGLINLNPENRIISPAPSDWRNWQDATMKLNDPYIVVEPVAGALK